MVNTEITISVDSIIISITSTAGVFSSHLESLQTAQGFENAEVLLLTFSSICKCVAPSSKPIYVSKS